ncbi:MAG: type II secretion system F family protein [Planctomycetes bacterium]|nr:type II secretion system F family protein [Planctomycetota bacterium]
MAQDLTIQVLVSLLLFGAVFLLVFALFRYPLPPEPEVNRRIAVAVGLGHRSTIFENRTLAPLMSLALSMARRFQFRTIRELVRRDLDAAGNPNGYSVEEYLGLSMVCGVGLGLLSTAIGMMLLGRIDPTVLVFMGIVGFATPIYSLHVSARARALRIGKQLPYTLDLIALTMAAGSSFTEAVETMIRDRPDEDLNQELRIVQAEIEFGTPRPTALANLAERIPLDSLRSVMGAVNQAEALGSPLSTILKTQSVMLRSARSVRAEKLSASASLRILIPSMLILFAAVLTLFGPWIIRIIVTGSFF